MEDYNNDDFDYKGKYIKLIAMYTDKEDELTKLIKETQALRSELEKERNNNYRLRYVLDEIKTTIQNG